MATVLEATPKDFHGEYPKIFHSILQGIFNNCSSMELHLKCTFCARRHEILQALTEVAHRVSTVADFVQDACEQENDEPDLGSCSNSSYGQQEDGKKERGKISS